MTKPLDQQIKEITEKIKKELEKTVKSKAFYDEIGEGVANQIRKRTRLGYGVNASGAQVKLEPTAPATQKAKQQKKKEGKLSNQTTPKRSNLTDTGQLLDSIHHKSTNDKTTIQFKNARKNSEIGNKRLAEIVQFIGGRIFFELTNPEKNNLKRVIEKKIQELIKRLK